jgi:hypothetical protein
MHLNIKGIGKPAIIFENGSGDFSFNLYGIWFNPQFPKQPLLFLTTEQAMHGVKKARFPEQEGKLPMNFIQHYRMQE